MLGGEIEIKVHGEKRGPSKDQFLHGANRRAVQLVELTMLTSVHSTDLLILQVLPTLVHCAVMSVCDGVHLFLNFKVHSYRNSLFTVVISVNHHCHCGFDYRISVC